MASESSQAKMYGIRGDRFREARHAFGCTLRELAEMTGYATTTLSSIENGHDVPSDRLVAKVVEVLDLDLRWLETGEGPIFSNKPLETCDRHVIGSWIGLESEDILKLLHEARDKAADYNIRAVELEESLRLKLKIEEMQKNQGQELIKPLTTEALGPTLPPLKPILPTLIERLQRATDGYGRKTELAKWLGVSRQSVNDWVSGRKEPSGETTLRLLHWVGQEERKPKQKSSGSVTPPPEPQTQVIKPNEKENNSGPP